MFEIVVLSGKGGTGKTSLTAAFAALAAPVVLTDCDVDAADLHLVLRPTRTEVHEFWSGFQARIDPALCRGCGRCAEVCAFDAITRDAPPLRSWAVDAMACEGCGLCARVCSAGAIEMREALCGEWFRSETRFGPMLHARLGVGGENSGKLVTLLRREARDAAAAVGMDLLLTDGPPGIGCPVIASLTGADHVLFVTEPTVSGLHDLRRVAELAAGFGVSGSVIVNKADINVEMSRQISAFAQDQGLTDLGCVPYTPAFTQAQVSGATVVETGDGALRTLLAGMWRKLRCQASCCTQVSGAAQSPACMPPTTRFRRD